MNLRKIDIIPFNKIHQSGIDSMMTEISKEFSEPIFTQTSKKIIDVAHLVTNKFWVALSEDKIIGTVGLSTLSNNSIVLKSMFLDRNFRGTGVSKLLLSTITKWCRKNDYRLVYLGTMDQFKGGQKFYKKNKFELIPKTALPNDFPINPIDSLFYRRGIASE